ncbi:hypothetical protein GcM3_054035, partial [Golovinomyces cichoracearum]
LTFINSIQAEKGVINSPITLEPRPISFDFDNEIYNTDPKVEEEYNIYLQEALIAGTADPLLYWKNNSSRLPILAILARRVLAIPATSASIERAFSVSNNIITRNRTRLLPNTVKKLILLKSWDLKSILDLEKQLKEEEISLEKELEEEENEEEEEDI